MFEGESKNESDKEELRTEKEGNMKEHLENIDQIKKKSPPVE